MAEDTRSGARKTARKINQSGAQLSQWGKVPPQAIDVEETILGALMLERDAITIAIEILNSDAFYKDEHKEIYAAIRSLFEKSQPIDLITVTNELRSLLTGFVLCANPVEAPGKACKEVTFS